MTMISAAAIQRRTSNHSRTNWPAKLALAPRAMKTAMTPKENATAEATARMRTARVSSPSSEIWFMLTPAM